MRLGQALTEAIPLFLLQRLNLHSEDILLCTCWSPWSACFLDLLVLFVVLVNEAAKEKKN